MNQPAPTIRATVSHPLSGGQEIVTDTVILPADAAQEAVKYLSRHSNIDAGSLLRIFANAWKAGVNLNNMPPNPCNEPSTHVPHYDTRPNPFL